MIDAIHVKAHRTTASLLKRALIPAASGGQKAALNFKLHAVCDAAGRPLVLLLPKAR